MRFLAVAGCGFSGRAGNVVTNFAERLPPPQSDLAREALKDPYVFDFPALAEDAQERDVERALTRHLTRFCSSWALAWRSSDASTGWKSAATSFLSISFSTISSCVAMLSSNSKRRRSSPNMRVSLTSTCPRSTRRSRRARISRRLGCCYARKERAVAEHALRGVASPMGVAEYQLLRDAPESLASGLPSIDQIAAELRPDLPDAQGQ